MHILFLIYIFYIFILKEKLHPSTHFAIIIFSYELLKHYHIHVFYHLRTAVVVVMQVRAPSTSQTAECGAQLLSTKI